MGGGKGGGKGGGGAEGPPWLNRKPWETDLWKEFTTSATSSTSSTTDSSTTVDTEAPEVKEAEEVIIQPVLKADINKRVGE